MKKLSEGVRTNNFVARSVGCLLRPYVAQCPLRTPFFEKYHVGRKLCTSIVTCSDSLGNNFDQALSIIY